MVLILIAGTEPHQPGHSLQRPAALLLAPLRRIDYFIGKLGVIGAFLGMVLVVPSIVAYVLGLLFSLDISIVADTFPLLLASVFYGAIMTCRPACSFWPYHRCREFPLRWAFLGRRWFITSLIALILDNANREEQRYRRYQKIQEAES